MSPVTQPAPAPVKEVPVVELSNDSFKSKKRKSMGGEDTVVRISCFLYWSLEFISFSRQMAMLHPTKEQNLLSKLMYST